MVLMQHVDAAAELCAWHAHWCAWHAHWCAWIAYLTMLSTLRHFLLMQTHNFIEWQSSNGIYPPSLPSAPSLVCC
jgi:hypothetical protein